MTTTALAPTRPLKQRWTVAVPLLAAAACGILAGFAPLPVLLGLLALAVGAAVILRLEWIALVRHVRLQRRCAWPACGPPAARLR